MKRSHCIIGLDVGSTTVKAVVIDAWGNILFRRYERHQAAVRERTRDLLQNALSKLGDCEITVALAGSAGLGIAHETGINFVQEVIATKTACQRLLPQADVAIELGGEDAKILFLTNGAEERMNGSCAGGTGAFIDQMASLLNLSLTDFDQLSLQHRQIYPIASRCGVFAKSDVQPLLNQGAQKADICASIYQSIVEQTVAGLAQGREIRGKVAFLGGPLTFMQGLRDRFIETLKLDETTALFPPLAEYFVAIGAALQGSGGVTMSLSQLIERFTSARSTSAYKGLPPLFATEDEYAFFQKRHQTADIERRDLQEYQGPAYLGIDAGSTTTKLALVDAEGRLLYSYYISNRGEPLPIVREQLLKIYELCGDRVTIAAGVVTGYGEELIRNAFHLDEGIVETSAHYEAARHFSPDVDFILDIGGQDMKCFRLQNGVVSSIMLNEACSSGCGSFIESFAGAMGYSTEEFARLGVAARHPVDLGSRCTVFMNSSVKQAQKDGADVADISAGLAVSVIKNALYKVIRSPKNEPLGRHIVVQGGTFLNNCVLRAFELELHTTVVRPAIAGLMGAYGAALYARGLGLKQSTLVSAAELIAFSHSSRTFECGLCGNHCRLTQNTFPAGRYLSGNRCQRPLGQQPYETPNVFIFRQQQLLSLQSGPNKRGRIGLPMGLNMWENLPFWHAIWTSLGFELVVSPLSSRALYVEGQNSIPSDTVCYPGKLMHGHIEYLLMANVDAIFYPCMTYGFNEHSGDNNYNCPVVAYYPELLQANMERLQGFRYLSPHFAPHMHGTFVKAACTFFDREFGIAASEVKPALEKGYQAHEASLQALREYGAQAIRQARETGRPIFVLAGRPYHVDPEVNHGIDQLIASLGAVVISEACISPQHLRAKVTVLNQWTYHARLYSAAEVVVQNSDMQLIQLVSFGCGLDAITSDEVDQILKRGGKFYTQIKIDEISNLGAARIRLRSLLEALQRQERRSHLQKVAQN